MSYKNRLLSQLRRINRESFEAVKTSRNFGRVEGEDREEILDSVEKSLQRAEKEIEKSKQFVEELREENRE